MHNTKTIYRITTYLIEKDFYDHWFLKDIANYIDEDIDRNIYLKNFKEWLENNEIGKFNSKNNSFVIIGQERENYFNSKFNKFKESLRKLNKINLYDFSTGLNDIEEEMTTLNKAFSKEYKTYILSDYRDNIIIFDDFIRHAEVEISYYISGNLDYN